MRVIVRPGEHDPLGRVLRQLNRKMESDLKALKYRRLFPRSSERRKAKARRARKRMLKHLGRS